MKHFTFRLLLSALATATIAPAAAQEVITAVTPLDISSSYNKDVIAESSTTRRIPWSTTYENPSAEMVDENNAHGRNAFYSDTFSDDPTIKAGAITITSDGYLDGNADYTDEKIAGKYNLRYKMGPVSGNNTVFINNNTRKEISLKTVDGTPLQPASALYVAALSAAGAAQVTVDVYGTTKKLGTWTGTIGDWWTEDPSEKLYVLKELLRVTVTGRNHEPFYNTSNTDEDTYVNLVNQGINRKGKFILQRINISVEDQSEPIAKIVVRRTSNIGNICIFAATAVTEEVTIRDDQTDLNYLKNQSTGFAIQKAVKAKVNVVRSFKDNQWNPLVLPFDMTAKEAKGMFGNNIKLVVADRFVQRNVIFNDVDLTSDDNEAIKAGSYYLIKGVQIDKDGTDTYSRACQLYENPVIIGGDTYPWESGLAETLQLTNETYSNLVCTFHGTYTIVKTGDNIYAMQGGKFHHFSTEPAKGMKGLRFWFDVTDKNTGAKLTLADLDFTAGNETTAIKAVADAEEQGARQGVYSLGGVRVANTPEGLPKGIYIVGNKKIVVR